ncbi:hypothetical protein NDU88_002276 [Pleurodeles waltl]|uniref:Uncharacterized protein n=1 Tax=Pleurodeles waltl TaxID=8319 RepID=A0AAV7VYW0_PLEWA|nr:hypothetical protein NDU88_002276 [Pleurodeles waltl]
MKSVARPQGRRTAAAACGQLVAGKSLVVAGLVDWLMCLWLRLTCASPWLCVHRSAGFGASVGGLVVGLHTWCLVGWAGSRQCGARQTISDKEW